MTAGAPLLSCHISVDYPKHAGVLRNVCLQIHSGEIVGLVGESGSGKSTIALALLQLLSVKNARITGEVIFEGEDLLKKEETDLRRMRGLRMSIVLQSPVASLNPALRTGAQLREAWQAHARGTEQECSMAIRTALRSARLPDDDEFLRRRPSQLSVGQAQRVNIALAILHRPALLIADEATSALDTITQSEILDLFAHLNRELHMAILYVSHDLLSVAALCDRVAILHKGTILETGPTHQIFTSPQAAYTQRLVGAAFMSRMADSSGSPVVVAHDFSPHYARKN